MKTRSLIALLLLAHSMAPASQAQSISVDTAGVGAVLDQALNHSEVMQNLAYLSDMIGPRLTGSPAMKKANDWTMERFKAYGMEAHLESYTFGVTWERGDASLKLVSPFPRAITAHSWAWTAGTERQDADRRSDPHQRHAGRQPQCLPAEGEGQVAHAE